MRTPSTLGLVFSPVGADDALISFFCFFAAFEAESIGQAFHHLRLIFRIANEGDAVEQSSDHTFDRRGVVSQRLLLELLAAEIDGLYGAHVGDIVERIFLQDKQVSGLAFGQRAEFLVDAQGLRGALREGLDHLHRRQA